MIYPKDRHKMTDKIEDVFSLFFDREEQHKIGERLRRDNSPIGVTLGEIFMWLENFLDIYAEFGWEEFIENCKSSIEINLLGKQRPSLREQLEAMPNVKKYQEKHGIFEFKKALDIIAEKARTRQEQRIGHSSVLPQFFVHKSSYVDNDVEIGEDTKIWHFSHIQSGAKIGNHCILGQNVNIGNNVIIGDYVKIQNNVSIYEGIILEDYVFCGPSMTFTNIRKPRCKYSQKGSKFYEKTLIKEGASLGAHCTILCGVTIGKHAFVGAHSFVNDNVPDHALVVGTPAKVIGWVSESGDKLNFNNDGLAYDKKTEKIYEKKYGGVDEHTKVL